jgi:hypothetical protein
MSKLYYTDPLKAAMMARDFGVKYTAGRPVYDKYEQEDYYNFFEHECDGYPECPTREYIRPQGLTKWHIHPDSYHIFELKEGDGVKSLISDNIYILQNPLLFSEGDKPITIQRNNTAFFMPIKEKDND